MGLWFSLKFCHPTPTTTTPTLHSQLLRGEPLGDLSLFLRNTPLVATFVLQTQVQGSLVASLRPHSLVLEPDFLNLQPRKMELHRAGALVAPPYSSARGSERPQLTALSFAAGIAQCFSLPHPPAPLLVRPQPPVPFERRKGLEFSRQIKFHVPP